MHSFELDFTTAGKDENYFNTVVNFLKIND